MYAPKPMNQSSDKIMPIRIKNSEPDLDSQRSVRFLNSTSGAGRPFRIVHQLPQIIEFLLRRSGGQRWLKAAFRLLRRSGGQRWLRAALRILLPRYGGQRWLKAAW